jgi:hypothetical protein
MNEDRLIFQKSIESDGGVVRASLTECVITGELTLRFGNSYTLRAAAGELAGLLGALHYVSSDVANVLEIHDDN